MTPVARLGGVLGLAATFVGLEVLIVGMTGVHPVGLAGVFLGAFLGLPGPKTPVLLDPAIACTEPL